MNQDNANWYYLTGIADRWLNLFIASDVNRLLVYFYCAALLLKNTYLFGIVPSKRNVCTYTAPSRKTLTIMLPRPPTNLTLATILNSYPCSWYNWCNGGGPNQNWTTSINSGSETIYITSREQWRMTSFKKATRLRFESVHMGDHVIGWVLYNMNLEYGNDEVCEAHFR